MDEKATCGEAYSADSSLLKYLHQIKPSENYEVLGRTLWKKKKRKQETADKRKFENGEIWNSIHVHYANLLCISL